jgi:peptidoglycan/xylan/chitin deacetylase (PgdA/CDA1 family)
MQPQPPEPASATVEPGPPRRQWPPRLGRWGFVAASAAVPLTAVLWLAGLSPGSLCLGLLGLWLTLAHLGSFYAPSGIFGPTLLRGPGRRPLVALTFDDGPDPEATPRVLEVLSRHGARATFFVIGERAARHPEVIAAIARAGHQIESHSHRHSWWTAFTPRRRLAAELQAAQAVIAAASGRAPRWLRPPIGILSPEVVAAARLVGLRLCAWSCKARDGLAGTSVAAALTRLRAGLSPGAILLLHDAAEPRPGPARPRPPIAPAVLEALLPELAARQLRAVTLDELLAELPAPDGGVPVSL